MTSKERLAQITFDIRRISNHQAEQWLLTQLNLAQNGLLDISTGFTEMNLFFDGYDRAVVENTYMSLCRTYGAFPVIGNKTAWEIANAMGINRHVISIGAGLGYVEHQIAATGTEVVAFDHETISDSGWFQDIKPYHDVQLGGIDQVSKFPRHNLLLSWPPLGTDMASTAAALFWMNSVADKLIYIGEEMYGCTAHDDFFHFVDMFFDLESVIHISNWMSIHDKVFIYKAVR